MILTISPATFDKGAMVLASVRWSTRTGGQGASQVLVVRIEQGEVVFDFPLTVTLQLADGRVNPSSRAVETRVRAGTVAARANRLPAATTSPRVDPVRRRKDPAAMGSCRYPLGKCQVE